MFYRMRPSSAIKPVKNVKEKKLYTYSFITLEQNNNLILEPNLEIVSGDPKSVVEKIKNIHREECVRDKSWTERSCATSQGYRRAVSIKKIKKKKKKKNGIPK